MGPSLGSNISQYKRPNGEIKLPQETRIHLESDHIFISHFPALYKAQNLSQKGLRTGPTGPTARPAQSAQNLLPAPLFHPKQRSKVPAARTAADQNRGSPAIVGRTKAVRHHGRPLPLSLLPKFLLSLSQFLFNRPSAFTVPSSSPAKLGLARPPLAGPEPAAVAAGLPSILVSLIWRLNPSFSLLCPHGTITVPAAWPATVAGRTSTGRTPEAGGGLLPELRPGKAKSTPPGLNQGSDRLRPILHSVSLSLSLPFSRSLSLMLSLSLSHKHGQGGLLGKDVCPRMKERVTLCHNINSHLTPRIR